jgi:hypothetical protein
LDSRIKCNRAMRTGFAGARLPALWRQDALGETLQVSRSERKKAVSDAWWGGRVVAPRVKKLLRNLFRQSPELLGKMK